MLHLQNALAIHTQLPDHESFFRYNSGRWLYMKANVSAALLTSPPQEFVTLHLKCRISSSVRAVQR